MDPSASFPGAESIADAGLGGAQPALSKRERDFVCEVRQKGKHLYRDLPWRRTTDPYAVLVSEVMLQQTQVGRVERYWDRFLQLFPSLDALSSADSASVLQAWQGLGYNRRALALKRTADICALRYAGQLPDAYDDLLALPGIGKATAAGVLVFAHDRQALYLETNVRTVFLHEFFPDEAEVSDKRIEPLVQRTCPKCDIRGWYYALLDYGAHLKATLPNPSCRSKHHTRQSNFEGSRRQKRAECVRFMLAMHQASFDEVYENLCSFEAEHDREAPDAHELVLILDALVEEGFFCCKDNCYWTG